jgi:hypothetical protein
MDLGTLAEREGEAWARRMLGHLQAWTGPIGSSWPGRLEEARLLAERLEAGPAMLEGVAERIQAHATQAWTRFAQAE